MSDIEIIEVNHTLYPPILEDANKGDPAYAIGNIDLLERKAIGICGSRKASDNALQYAYEFGRGAAKKGIVVVSGYARGVDRQAHKGALEAGGDTIAVLAEGIDNFKLVSELRELVESGNNFLALSMFERNARWQVWRAMQRNKLIVGLSAGLFVIEARATGGTIEAAREAARQGKRVWAIAYKNDSSGREGNRILIGGSAIPLEAMSDLEQALKDAEKDPPADVEQLMMNLIAEDSIEYGSD